MGSQTPTDPHQFTLLSIDRNSGKIVWQKALRTEVPHEGHHPDHGFASASPVTDGEHVFSYFGSRGLYGLDLNGNHRAQEREGFRRCGATISAGSGRALINYVEIARIQGQICNDSGLPTALLIDSFSRLL